MSRASKPRNTKPPPGSSKDSVVGQPLRNKLLMALLKGERNVLFRRLEFFVLPVGMNLSEKGATIKFGYFLNEGLA